MAINLVLVKKSGTHKAFPLPNSVTVIGRQRTCDLRIPLGTVSKKHCKLHHFDGVLKISDLGSRNGTGLNGKQIKEAIIQAGDYISVGPVKFVCQIDGHPEKISIPAAAAKKPADKKPANAPPAKADETGTGLTEFDLSDETSMT